MLALGAALAFGPAAWAGAETAPRLSARAVRRIAVSNNSFREMFVTPAGQTAQLTLLDFPAFVRTRLGLRNLELISTHFTSMSDAYCRELRASAKAAGCRIVNVLHSDRRVDMVGGDEASRAAGLQSVKDWMTRASTLGAGSLRTNANYTASNTLDENARVVAVFRELAEFGQGIGVKILVENHVGYTSSIANTLRVVREVDHPYCRAIVDWGNSSAADDDARAADIQILMPYVELVSAKGIEFDADGRHMSFDQARLVQAAETGGFRGMYSVDLYSERAPKDSVGAAASMIRTISEGLARG